MEDFTPKTPEAQTPGSEPQPQRVPPEPPVNPPQEVPDFQVDTVTDAQGIRAIMDMLLAPLFRVGYWVLAVICLVLGVLLILLDRGLTLLNGACLFLGLFIIFLRLQLPERIVRRQLKVLRESYGTESVPIHLVFWPQGLVVNNTISGAHQNIRYDIIKLLICRKGYLVLRTQAGQSVILPMADLASQPNLVPYLLAKCPGAKKKGF